MNDARFTIEFAKSGRAACKKCKQKIDKGAMRIGMHYEIEDKGWSQTSWTHVGCFRLPRKYTTGADKVTVEEFVASVLEDSSEGGTILTNQKDEVLSLMEAANAGTSKKVRGSNAGAATDGPIAELKRAFEQCNDNENEQPSSKKVKTTDKYLDAKLDAYAEYGGMKAGELKEMLKWNNQYQTGNKDFLIFKCVDGKVHGRLQRCNLCGGNLKINETGTKVVCNGNFDEDTMQRIECAFVSALDAAPRWKPWYDVEPTQEEEDAMNEQIEAYKEAGGVPSNDSKDSGEYEAKLLKNIAKVEWNLADKAGLKATVKELAAVLTSDECEPKLDIAKENAKTCIGALINMNRDKTAEEMVPLLIQNFGIAEEKAKKAAEKEQAFAEAIACAANAGIVAALKELSDLYFKGGNTNAGLTYKKAVAAISEYPDEITEDNAKGLGKGKTKVQNIGKGTADKIHEFVTTGTIAKLEEKRADMA